MKIARREFLLSASALTMLAATAGCGGPNAVDAPPAATIEGPIAVTAESGEPFRGSNEQAVAGPGLPPAMLAPYNYVEEEYFVSGEVEGQAYKTSLLVRKPSDPARFSGLVAVETIHAAGAIPFWGSGRQTWMPGGHAWVSVGSQLAALNGHVKRSNAARYESLAIPDVRTEEQRAAQARQEAAMTQPQAGAPPAQPAAPPAPGGPPAEDPQDKFSQAILTQVGQLLKNNAANGPLQGLQVTKLVMGGASQTGGATLRFIAQSHAAARRPDGGPIYDGYFPAESFPAEQLPAIDAAIMNAVTEGDVMNAIERQRPMAVRDDADAENDRYRHYQLTGAAHVVTRDGTDSVTMARLGGGGTGQPETLSQFPNGAFFTGFVDNLVAWVMNGTAPPPGTRLEMADGQIARDEHGNARGGIRSPYVDLPTVHYIAAAPMRPGDTGTRRLIGIQEPIPAARLRQMYPSKAEYLRRFGEGIDQVVAGKWIRREDGETLKTEEAANPVLSALR